MIEIVFIAQPDIQVEKHLLMMRGRIAALGAQRVGIDSVSVFLHKLTDPKTAREKIFQLATIIQNAQAVGFFATDIPYGSSLLSRFGVEETVVDGVILLSSREEGLERQRYLEVYKLRNTAHLKGSHSMMIGPGGITVFPRYEAEAELEAPPPLERSRRLSSGVPGLDLLLGGGMIERSVTLVSGSAGIGKSTLSLQFIADGVARGEPGLYVALEEGPAQLLDAAEALGLPLQAATDRGLVEVMYLTRTHVRASQFLAILADRIQTQQTRRLVLDGVSHIVAEGMASDELRQLLQALVTRFKTLGVTSLFTLESSTLVAADAVTDRGFSNIADNIILLRYAQRHGELLPTLTVVKTRSSPHDMATYGVTIAAGGLRIGERVEQPPGK
jgi:circadian clock protein KaiC